MTAHVLAALTAGMGVGVGALMIVLGLTGHDASRPDRGPRTMSLPQVPLAHVAGSALAGMVMFLVTGWVIGAALCAVAVVTLPSSFSRRGDEVADIERMDAVAAWAEMLRDTMAAAAGLEEAIISTAAVAPHPIRGPVKRLASRLQRERLGPALRDLAHEVDDATADLVVTALSMAESKPARDLGSLLGALASSARMEVSMRRRVHAGRARLRTAVRVVTVTTLGFAGLLILFNNDFLAPYDDALGQAWLLVVGMLFAGAIVALRRMARIEDAPRLFVTRTPTGAAGPC